MSLREIADGVWWCGAVDWDRRMFDALVPTPAGTSYNAYLVRGSEKTALLDTVDETQQSALLDSLRDVPRLDYVVSHHAEQDHSGTIPAVLARYPEARVLATPAGCNLLRDLVDLPADRVQAVKDGETLPLGGKTLRFLATPWVHWPETMVSWLEEDGILFSCDLFGSHLATSDLYAEDRLRVCHEAQRYYAQIMMPYAKFVAKNIEKVGALPLRVIAPSHGPLFRDPEFIVNAWREWASAPPGNAAVVAYVSMHHSTRKMAARLVETLTAQGVRVEQFDLAATDLGLLAMALIHASTLCLGTPAVLNGLHPFAAHAAYVINALKPKLRHAALFGSYGWGPKPLENLAAHLPDLALEILPPALCRGRPRDPDFRALDALAGNIAAKHAGAG
jgi:flavorubredoxin